jgi:DNA-binding NtrC family response regulator
VIEVVVPALRDRLEDLPLLVDHLAPRLARETGQTSFRLGPTAWETLERHTWPGNVRELRTVLARALLRAHGSSIEARHLDLQQPAAAPFSAGPGAVPLERKMIEAALAGDGGSITAAAKRIGWSRQKLYRRMRALSIPTDAAA